MLFRSQLDILKFVEHRAAVGRPLHQLTISLGAICVADKLSDVCAVTMPGLELKWELFDPLEDPWAPWDNSTDKPVLTPWHGSLTFTDDLEQ